MCEKFNEAVNPVVQNLREKLLNIPDNIKTQIFEIRFRANQPIIINAKNEFYFIGKNSRLHTSINDAIVVRQEDIKNTFSSMCNHSVYSYQNEIKNGFITLKGGHRVGICGTAVLSNENIFNLRDVNSLNIRIAHSEVGLMHNWRDIFAEPFSGILIVGEPASGKTTILRNIAKALANGNIGRIKNVSVIDERNEIAASYCGIPQINLGFCDVLTGYPKHVGFEHAIRTLSPEIIICDEIGNSDDATSIEHAVNCGVKIIATFHSGNVHDLINNARAKNVLKTGAFDKIIILKGKKSPGEISKIYKMEDLKDEIGRSNDVSDFIGSNGTFSIA